MGTVYLALDLKHGRRVAIKILPPDLAQAVGPERFLREIATSARLNHPHILSVHDSGQAAGLLYYVMPFVDGESLRARLERVGGGTLPLEQALRIAAELADALAYSHSEGVIHRDVKPDNVMLAGDHAFLADFGVARASDSPGDLTETGLTVGTRLYSSPEQAAGSRDVDARSDLYSLGCVLFEILAGPAHDGETTAEVLERRLVRPLPPLARTRPDVPGWVDRLIAKATAQDPDDRFATAEEFRRALLEPVGTRESGKPRRWRRVHWIAAGLSALAIGAAAVALYSARTPELDRQRVVVAGFENKTGDSTLVPIGDIASDYVARGLAATHLIHDVFDARTLALEAGERPRPGATAGRDLAKRVGAGTVLWGSYYLEGDSLHFEAQLTDAASGRVILALEPVAGAVADKTRLVELLRQRVMAGFAVVISPDFDNWRAGAIPPTYEAYQEILAGNEASWQSDFAGAASHYRRAGHLDSNFTSAQTLLALELWLQGDCAGVDSVAGRLAPRLASLPALDRLQLEYATAACRHDANAALAAAKAALDVAPLSAGITVLGALQAMDLGRPREAIEVLHRYDPERAGLKGQPLVLYLDWMARAYHQLGMHAEELSAARAGLRAVPGEPHLLVAEAAALAGLGRTGEAERLAISWVSDHAPGDAWKSEKAGCTALELYAHGDSAASRRVFDREVAWYGPTGAAAAVGDDLLPCHWDSFSPHYYVGDWDAARTGYEQLLAKDSSSFKAHAALGAIAAHRGDREAAQRADEWLAGRKNADATVARARLAVLLGDRDRAVSLLRRAQDQGLDSIAIVHLDHDFASLRDYPPFRALTQPKR